MAFSNSAILAMRTRVKSLIVNDLKNICRDENLAVSGTKAILQDRIDNHTSDHASLASMRTSIMARSTGYRTELPPITPTTTSSHPQANGISDGFGASGAIPRAAGATQFRPSPFFDVIEILTKPLELPPFPSHRNSAALHIFLSAQQVDRLRGDSALRVLLYCAAKHELVGGNIADVAFPSQLEIRVNGEEVRTNFKGVKNKPGSTRPADITAFIKRQTSYRNEVMTTYALTQKGFTMIATLVKKRSVDELVERISRGKVITKDRVLSDMAMRASDPDIVVGSADMTLKDPVSYMRIAVPCRSNVCSHYQCFDAASFLQLQEQAPTWTCPICNKTVSFEGLVVDQYFQDILRNTSSSTYQVTVQPDGTWSESGVEKSSRNGVKNESDSDESDDDLIEVIPPTSRQSFGAPAGPVTPYSMAAPTPPRASSTALSAAASIASGVRPGQKRKSEVIDLTLSEDDDEPPAKRPSYNAANSFPEHGTTGRMNGYNNNYPNTQPNVSSRANGPLRFQMSSSGSSSTYNNYDHSTSSTNILESYNNRNRTISPLLFGQPSRLGQHQLSPLGTAHAPINLTESPPNRPPSSLAAYSATSNFGLDQPRRPVNPSIFETPDYHNYGHINALASPQGRTWYNPQPPNQEGDDRPPPASDQRQTLRNLANTFGS